MKYVLHTAGEQLAYFIEEQLFTPSIWDKLTESLYFTGRGAELCGFFNEFSVIKMKCKIVYARN
jgi:hypothetical protein